MSTLDVEDPIFSPLARLDSAEVLNARRRIFVARLKRVLARLVAEALIDESRFKINAAEDAAAMPWRPSRPRTSWWRRFRANIGLDSAQPVDASAGDRLSLAEARVKTAKAQHERLIHFDLPELLRRAEETADSVEKLDGRTAGVQPDQDAQPPKNGRRASGQSQVRS
ncbi:MAG: hypothetical protein WC526_00820 [Patescibacteria group bacterium]